MPQSRHKIMHPREILSAMASKVGCNLGTIGDIERLAGVNTCCEAERRALWNQFKHLFDGPSQALVDAVMDHCSAIAIKRINAGVLSLVRTTRL